jgi:hypothetical protein
MTTEMFDNAINGIRPELIEEAANISPATVRKPYYKYAAVAAVFALCVAGGALTVSHITRTPTGTTSEISNIGENDLYGGEVDNSVYGNTGNSAISDNKPIIKGTAYTDEEIISLIEANKEIIALNISAEYGRFGEEVQIFTKGYYHVILGETNCVDLDFLTLPVCIDNKIVGNIEVFRHNAEIMYSLNAGGNKWDAMNEALAYSDNIAFVFGGSASEVAIAPDNTIFEITHDAKSTVTAGYDLLATEYNTFSASELTDENNYITATAKE